MNPSNAPSSPSTPPRSAERMLGALGADPEVRELFLGDLAEEHAIRAAFDGDRAAARWYWSEAFRLAPYLLRDAARRLRGREVARLVGVVLTAYVVASTFNVGSSYMGWDVPALFGLGPSLAAMLVQNGVAQMLGGYISATLDGRRPLVAALAYGVAFSGVHLVSMVGGVHVAGWPLWVRIVQLALVVVAALLGGVLRVHTRRPAREDVERVVRRGAR